MNTRAQDKMNEAPSMESSFSKSPALIFFLIALTVFISEAAVMLLLNFLSPESLWVEAFMDATLLVAIISPALYFFLFRPMVGHIRERDKVVEILSENQEEQFKSMIRASLDGFWITDTQGRFLEVNDAYCSMMGYSREEFLNMSISDMDVEGITADTASHMKKLLESGRECFETRHRHKDGHILNIDVSANYSEFHGGRIYCFLRDITSRKKSEDQLRIAAAAFETHDAIMITDANANLIRVNQAFEEITGYSSEEVLGRNPRILKSGRHDREFYAAMWLQLLQTGSWTGEIWDRRKAGDIYPKYVSISAVRDANGNITNYVSIFTDISERKASEERVQHLAYHDPLTGLTNRLGLHERLTQALGLVKRKEGLLALMLIDLDNFKSINDTLGHLAGDQLLVEVAQRLVNAVRQSDIVVRLGGDEFVIILPDIESPTDAAHVADKVLHSVSEPYLFDAQELRTSPSIGISLYPEDASEAQDLLKKADVAMYHAKSQGRRNYQFFTEGMQRATMWRIGIENDLRVALEQQQFMLYYQPQLDLSSGLLVGVEALVRWQHPERGMVSPLEFIAIAEETGLILPLGDWVLREACRQLAEWRAGGIMHIKMSINLAAKQFSDPNLPVRIQEILAMYALPADSIDLEVTESMTMGSPADAIEMMKVLTRHGQSMSIDDFGTGYSSLAYLKLFPISTLKIDRAFVKDIETDENDASICDITVLLAHKLGMKVVAEGVETDAQLKYLLSIGCEKIQGYLISKPLPADQVEHFIRTTPRMIGLGTVELWTSSE